MHKNQLQEKEHKKERKEYIVLDEITEKVKVPEIIIIKSHNNNNHHNSNKHLKHLKLVLEDLPG